MYGVTSTIHQWISCLWVDMLHGRPHYQLPAGKIAAIHKKNVNYYYNLATPGQVSPAAANYSISTWKKERKKFLFCITCLYILKDWLLHLIKYSSAYLREGARHKYIV